MHSLGISQILAYGVMFYAFAQLKQPLSDYFQITETRFLGVLSLTLITQAVCAPIIGRWTDRYSALRMMAAGFTLGAAGLMILPLFTDFVWLCLCMMVISFASGLSTYELAFSAAVQIDEARSRTNISYITFYGAVASSVIWLCLGLLLPLFGLWQTVMMLALVLAGMGLWMTRLARIFSQAEQDQKQRLTPFSFSSLHLSEKRATLLLGLAGGLEYLAFSAAALMWISFFSDMFGSAVVAVFLASIYGPFQLVGRVIEMVAGHGYDARLTGALASLLVPISLFLASFDHIGLSILAMMLFGMGHGVLTVSFGFISNLYFRAEIYGRAKALHAIPRTLGLACGPFAGSWLYSLFPEQFVFILCVLTLFSGASFWALLGQRPTNSIHFKD